MSADAVDCRLTVADCRGGDCRLRIDEFEKVTIAD
jgi:hypothetical protein